MKVLALVSTFNEEKRISATLEALKQISLIDQIVVVNDGSTDATEKRAEQAGVKVISLPQNVGKGKALNFALEQVGVDMAEVILLADGDLAESASEVEKLLRPVLQGEADMAIADFPKPQVRGGFGLVKNLARWGIRRLTGLTMEEPLSGQRAIKREVFAALGGLEKGFGVEVGLTIDAARAGYRIVEIPTRMSHAETGRNLKGFVHRGRQLRDVLRVIVKRAI